MVQFPVYDYVNHTVYRLHVCQPYQQNQLVGNITVYGGSNARPRQYRLLLVEFLRLAIVSNKGIWF